MPLASRFDHQHKAVGGDDYAWGLLLGAELPDQKTPKTRLLAVSGHIAQFSPVFCLFSVFSRVFLHDHRTIWDDISGNIMSMAMVNPKGLTKMTWGREVRKGRLTTWSTTVRTQKYLPA